MRGIQRSEIESIAAIAVSGEIEDCGPVMPYYAGGQRVYVNIRGLCHGSIGYWDQFTHKWWRSSYKLITDAGLSKQTSTSWHLISSWGHLQSWRDDRSGVEVPGTMPARDLMVTVELHVGTEYSAHAVASTSIIIPHHTSPPPPECDVSRPCPNGWVCVDGQCIPSNGGEPCAIDSDCPAGYKCVGGKCVPVSAKAFPWEWVVIGGGLGLGLVLVGSKEIKKLRLK